LETLELARKIVEVASDKQAIDIVLLDVGQICSFTDYFVICTGESERQIEAIHEAIDKTLKQEGALPHRSEGPAKSGWVLLDFGRVIVHIFAPFEREYYQLDQLWKKAQLLVKVL
jgi:ribosome-associated protein